MTNEDGTGGLFGTCLHVPMRGAQNRIFDCQLAITLPIHLAHETWPRIDDEAARHAARAANEARKILLALEHADKLSCRAFYNNMTSKLRPIRRWPGGEVVYCQNYRGKGLPDFYIRRGALLVGNYLEWSKRPL